MSAIARFRISGVVYTTPFLNGEWVRYADHLMEAARLTGQNSKYWAEIERMKNAIDHLTSERNEAQAEVERLKEQVAALTVAVEQADEAKADAEAAAAREEAETDRVVADGNRALADVERLTVELHETREKLTRVQVQYDEFAKVTAKVIDQHQRERDHARQQVYLLREAGADRPSDEDIWREAFMRQLHDHHAPNWATTADVALAEYRKRWPR